MSGKDSVRSDWWTFRYRDGLGGECVVGKLSEAQARKLFLTYRDLSATDDPPVLTDFRLVHVVQTETVIER